MRRNQVGSSKGGELFEFPLSAVAAFHRQRVYRSERQQSCYLKVHFKDIPSTEHLIPGVENI